MKSRTNLMMRNIIKQYKNNNININIFTEELKELFFPNFYKIDECILIERESIKKIDSIGIFKVLHRCIEVFIFYQHMTSY